MEDIGMLMVNTQDIPGKRVEAISLVSGICIMSRHIGKDIGAGLRNLVGGEMKAYVEMLNQSKEEALLRMEEEAKRLGADAVVNIRFTTSSIIQGGAEVLAYGTAVKYV